MNNFLSPKDTAKAFDNVAIAKASLSTGKLILLGIFAGMFIGFGGFASQVISHTILNPGLAKFASGAVFPVGLMLVLIAGAELFTGNNLMIIGVMDNKITVSQLLRNWILVYIGNLIGSVVFAYLISQSGLLNLTEGLLGATAIKTAISKTSLSFHEALIRGIFCNMLVVLAVWMATASKDVISKIYAAWFPVMLFVMSGFEHSIANMYFIPVGLFAKSNYMYIKNWGITKAALGKLNIRGLISNLLPVTLGNILGGAIIVGLSYWYIYRKDDMMDNTIQGSN